MLARNIASLGWSLEHLPSDHGSHPQPVDRPVKVALLVHPSNLDQAPIYERDF
jgi:hypothetical protein